MESTFVNTKAITQLGLIPEVSFISKCGTMTCHRGEMDVQVQPIHVPGARRGWGFAPYPDRQSRYPISPALSSPVSVYLYYVLPRCCLRHFTSSEDLPCIKHCWCVPTTNSSFPNYLLSNIIKIGIMIKIDDGWFHTCYGKVQYVVGTRKYKFTCARVTHNGMC